MNIFIFFFSFLGGFLFSLFDCIRERWPLEMLSSSSLGVRKAYLDCRTALHQLKFADPFVLDLYTEASHFDHILLDKNDIIFSQV